MKKPIFYILGRPLCETAANSTQFNEVLESSQIIIAESRKIASRVLGKLKLGPTVHFFHLDNQNPRDEKELEGLLRQMLKEGGTVSLFSDMGMPILFDPGAKVLQFARKLGFQVRCLPGPTSWGTACAISGWNPPFTLVGFLPQKATERTEKLQRLTQIQGHLVLMDTPYRFLSLLSDCHKAFGPKRQAFLAWEIGNPEEIYFWGNFQEIEREASSRQLKKGEFILIIQDPSVK